MADAAKPTKTKKPSCLRWRGVMANFDRMPRAITALMLAVACASLAFCQLGFVGVTLPDGTVGYIIVLLQAVSLGALLLGTLSGAVLGLFAGAVLCAHALLLPIDFYELSFVTPLTSIFMLGVAGLLTGLLFALVLRNNPGQPRRIIFIAIVCIVVSWLYSIGFMFNVVGTLTLELADTLSENATDAEISNALDVNMSEMAIRLGSIRLQAWVDAILMIVLCGIGDVVARKAEPIANRIGLRPLFGISLSVVFLLVFMITSAVSFIKITLDEFDHGTNSMKSETTYLCNQLNGYETRSRALETLLNDLNLSPDNIPDEQFENLVFSTSFQNLLDGYSVSDNGTVVVTYKSNDVAISNDSRFEQFSKLYEHLNDEVLFAISESLKTGEIQRVIYEDIDPSVVREQGFMTETGHSCLAYLYSQEAGNYQITTIVPASMMYSNRSSVMVSSTISLLIALLAIFALISQLLNRVVIRRIEETNGALARVTDGDLDARVDVHDTIEFDSLSTGINDTVGALKGWIAEAESRMDAELATAKAIQESALPRTFPPFPDILNFDIYASMNAAREVGGDFYDFFLIGADSGPDSGKLGFVIADVSGKGVPAALFMMKSMTLIRDYLESGMEVGEAVENANRQLCAGNDAGMFVTTWVGVLDYATGHVDFVNAGHNPPLLWQGASWRWLTEKSGLPLGLFDGLPYTAHSVECAIGDQFLLYTDGVTEAMNVNDELYGENRLEELAGKNFSLHPRELVETVRHDVATHAAGAEQSDDITIMAMEVGVPPEVTATLVLPAIVDELPRVNAFIHTELDRRLCPLRAQTQLDIAVEELFVNVCHYAYPDATPEKPGTVRVSYTYRAEPPSVQIDIADDGIEYNPLAKPDAVTPDDIMDVPIGGLGILMAKRSVNEMSYKREDGSNIVTIIKKW